MALNVFFIIIIIIHSQNSGALQLYNLLEKSTYVPS